MSLRNALLIVMGLIFFPCAPVQAQQNNEVAVPNSDVSKLYGDGDNRPDVATALTNQAELFKAQGRYADAEALYQRCLSIREKGLGPDHLDVATALNNLADLYLSQGRYADAEPLYERAVVIYEKALGPSDVQAAAVGATAPNSAPVSPENAIAVHKNEEAAAPTIAATPGEPPQAPIGGQATTEYHGGADAARNRDLRKEDSAAPVNAVSPDEPSPGGGQVTAESPTRPAWTADTTRNGGYAKRETLAAASSATPTSPVHDGDVETCREKFNTKAQSAKIFFANSSIEIQPGSRGTLRIIAAIIKNCGDVVVEVGGHTDNSGTPDYNKNSFSASSKRGGRFPDRGRR